MLWDDGGMLYFWVTERGLRQEHFGDVSVVLQISGRNTSGSATSMLATERSW